jgi:hypothetical protein
MTRTDFQANAKPLNLAIAGVPMVADPKSFSTGTLGWYANGKTNVQVNGEVVAVQVQVQLFIVGSKDLS